MDMKESQKTIRPATIYLIVVAGVLTALLLVALVAGLAFVITDSWPSLSTITDSPKPVEQEENLDDLHARDTLLGAMTAARSIDVWFIPDVMDGGLEEVEAIMGKLQVAAGESMDIIEEPSRHHWEVSVTPLKGDWVGFAVLSESGNCYASRSRREPSSGTPEDEWAKGRKSECFAASFEDDEFSQVAQP